MDKNKGFSLVELLITIAILSIVLITVTGVMLSGTRSFTKGNADATMQREAQLVVNQVENLIIDTNGGVDYIDNTDTRELILYNVTDISGVPIYTKEVVKWTDSDDKLVYSKWNLMLDATTGDYVEDGAAIYADQLLGEEIRDFSVDLSDLRKEYANDGSEIDILQSVKISVGCSGNDGQVTYSTSPIVTLRNRMMLCDSPSIIFDNTPAATDALTLYISAVGAEVLTRVPIQDRVTECEKGNAYNIHAIINTENSVNDLVNWSIEEADSVSTISADGVLTVGMLEQNQYLTIVAAYKNNATKVVKAVVAVPPARKITSVKILPISYKEHTLKYTVSVETEGFKPEALATDLIYEWSVSGTNTQCPKPDCNCVYVAPFDDDNSELELYVTACSARCGEVITVQLNVTGVRCENAKTATVMYSLPESGDTQENIQKRGTTVGCAFAITDQYRSVGEPPASYYFCDIYGNRIDEFNDLLGNITVSDVTPGTFNVTIADSLPKDVSYILKVIIHCKNPTDPTIQWDYERLIYIYAEE